MNKQALKALKASIAHWYRISGCITPWELTNEGYTGDECPLCIEFFVEQALDLHILYGLKPSPCQGCPIEKDTGKYSCEGTPYGKAAQSLRNWKMTGIWYKMDQANVEAEIRYLEGLLP